MRIVSIPSQQEEQVKILRKAIYSLKYRTAASANDCSVAEEVIGERHFFECYYDEHETGFMSCFSDLLTDYFFTHVQKQLIPQLIHKLYKSSYPQDIAEIEGRIQRLLEQQAQEEIELKRSQVTRQFELWFAENCHLAIDGYVRFRSKAFKRWLSQYVQEAIDEYLLDREYKEFIQLLKYFVSIQTSRFPCVHVVHQPQKKFRLLKEDGSMIRVNEMDVMFREMVGQSFSGEDFIVGALLSTAPEQVVLHTQTPELNVIRTLMQIFEERITICAGCSTCMH